MLTEDDYKSICYVTASGRKSAVDGQRTSSQYHGMNLIIFKSGFLFRVLHKLSIYFALYLLRFSALGSTSTCISLLVDIQGGWCGLHLNSHLKRRAVRANPLR